MADETTERLHLRAETLDDVAPLSALAQDMAARAGDMTFDRRARRFALVGNRFRHEDRAQPSRVRAALRFDFVLDAQRRQWPADPDAVLALLSIVPESQDTLVLAFAGGADVRLRVECVDATLDDLSGPWGAGATPDHGRG